MSAKNKRRLEVLTTSLVGKTKEEALKMCQSLNFAVRIINENGHNYIYTMDFNPERINLSIEEDKVHKIDLF
jgi:hypothetical protein